MFGVGLYSDPATQPSTGFGYFFMKRIALGIIAAALIGCSASPTSQPSTDPKPATNQIESECPYGKHFWTGTCKTQKEVQSDAITWDNPKDLNNGK